MSSVDLIVSVAATSSSVGARGLRDGPLGDTDTVRIIRIRSSAYYLTELVGVTHIRIQW